MLAEGRLQIWRALAGALLVLSTVVLRSPMIEANGYYTTIDNYGSAIDQLAKANALADYADTFRAIEAEAAPDRAMLLIEPLDLAQLAKAQRNSDEAGYINLAPYFVAERRRDDSIGPINSADPIEPSLAISEPINNPIEFEAAALADKLRQTLIQIANETNNNDNPLDIANGNDISNDIASSNNINSDAFGDDNQDNGITSDHDNYPQFETNAQSASSRYGNNEYIDHPLALVGHQYVQGGAGEGQQLLGPEGSFENIQVIKTDRASPSYCDPPNPCPIGFTSRDGCLEKFVNSASFSREYQAKQQCSCDKEHSLFNCASPLSSLKGQTAAESDNDQSTTVAVDDGDGDVSEEQKVNTLARAIQNRLGDLDAVKKIIDKQNQHDDEHLMRAARKSPALVN